MNNCPAKLKQVSQPHAVIGNITVKVIKIAGFSLVLISICNCLSACSQSSKSTKKVVSTPTTTPATSITPSNLGTPSRSPIDPLTGLELPPIPDTPFSNDKIPNIPTVASDTFGQRREQVTEKTTFVAPNQSSGTTQPEKPVVWQQGGTPAAKSSVPRTAIASNKAYTSYSNPIEFRVPGNTSSTTTVPEKRGNTAKKIKVVATDGSSRTTTGRQIDVLQSRRAIAPLQLPVSQVRPVKSPIPVIAKSSSYPQLQYSQQSISDANAVVRGLVVAKHKGEIQPDTTTWRKTQDAVILLRQGKTRQQAAAKANIPLSLLTQLIEWGQQNQPKITSIKPGKGTLALANSENWQQSISDANAVVRGLVVAKHKGEIQPDTTTWRKTQDAVILLRQGKTRQQAAAKANIPLSLLTQLIEWGQQNQPTAESMLDIQSGQLR